MGHSCKIGIFGSFLLHLLIVHLVGFWWDDHSRSQNWWDRSQQLPSQSPTNHPRVFFDIFLFPYQKQKLVVTLKIGKNINIITKVKVWWDFGGMNIQVDKYNIITEGKLLINLRITFQNAIWMGYVQMIVISHGGGIRPNNYNIYRDSQPKVIT